MMNKTADQAFFTRDGINQDLQRRRGFRFSDRAIRQAIRDGELRGVRIGRQQVFTPADIDRWLETKHAAAQAS